MHWSYVGLALTVWLGFSRPAAADQSGLNPDTEMRSPTLKFDWPAIEIGVGSYEAGPTGLTVIHFVPRAAVVEDSRGGAPGTVNTARLQLGYDAPRMDAVVFSGGSSYGEEAITAVATGLKDEGVRSGAWNNIADVTGAIIYDFGSSRRLNEIYPDKALAQATLQHLHPGIFPLGAQGGGRMAMQGGFFGCNAHSGQGAAFRQIGEVKIAAFVVVNASGVITNRQGELVSCHSAASWGPSMKVSELMKNVPLSRIESWQPPGGGNEPTHTNTTVSLIVTNKRLDYAGLKRLAIQVHTSMARAIQPFSTFDDGDTLFAATTDEVSGATLTQINLDTVASDVMWDAILASVPEQTEPKAAGHVQVSEADLQRLVGRYDFGSNVILQVSEEKGALEVLTLGKNAFEFETAKPIPIIPASASDFYVDSRYRTHLAFDVQDGKVTAAVLNPGPWEQRGHKMSPQ